MQKSTTTNSQIKSKNRVKAHAEVYTAEREVKAMCDLVPSETWENIESTFLEPACGNGNFLAEIFARKLKNCENERDGLKALNSIFAIDIQQDNVDECKERLLKMYTDKFPNASDTAIALAIAIMRKRIICDDMLNPQTKIVKSWGIEAKPSYAKFKEKKK